MAGLFGNKDGRIVNLFQVNREEAFDASKIAEGFRRRPATGWSIAEAYLAVLLAAATADGRVDDAERQMILWISRRSRALRDMSVEALSAANESVNQRLQSADALQDACDTLPVDLVPSVFAHCCQLALADGELSSEETRYLQQLASALKLEEAQAAKILEVILIAAS